MPFIPQAPPLNALHHVSATWHSELALRAKHLLWLKLSGVSLFVWLFFIAYFYVLRHASRPVMLMPTTFIDAWIPFQPIALGAYVSLWLYLGIAPGLLLGLRALIVYGLWAGGLCVAGLASFFFWPTSVQAFAVDLNAHPAFALLQGIDGPGNACPSLHVATAAFTATWIEHLLRKIGAPSGLRWGNLAWFAAIAYSTLAVKQHVLLDVAAGLALGLLFAGLSLRWHAEESQPQSNAYHRPR